MSSKKGKNLLDEVKDIMRLKHYSIHKEEINAIRAQKGRTYNYKIPLNPPFPKGET